MPLLHERIQAPRRARLFRLLFGGIIAVLLTGALFFINPGEEEENTTPNIIAVQTGALQRVSFPDSCQIWLSVSPSSGGAFHLRNIRLLFIPDTSLGAPETPLKLKLEGFIKAPGLFLNVPPQDFSSPFEVRFSLPENRLSAGPPALSVLP